jgi:hypothetical protein
LVPTSSPAEHASSAATPQSNKRRSGAEAMLSPLGRASVAHALDSRAEATPSSFVRGSAAHTQRALDTPLSPFNADDGAAAVVEADSGQPGSRTPLPNNLSVLLEKMKALDWCVLAARTLERRTFSALKASVENRAPETNFTKEDLQRTCNWLLFVLLRLCRQRACVRALALLLLVLLPLALAQYLTMVSLSTACVRSRSCPCFCSCSLLLLSRWADTCSLPCVPIAHNHHRHPGILAVAPSLFTVEVVFVNGERQWAIKHAGLVSIASHRSALT